MRISRPAKVKVRSPLAPPRTHAISGPNTNRERMAGRGPPGAGAPAMRPRSPATRPRKRLPRL
eukprot:2277348-Lingulodinium_polyedra.AAC.1